LAKHSIAPNSLLKAGAATMIDSNILAVVQSAMTDTASGTWQKPAIMFVCNLLALLVLSRRIWHPHVGPKMPLPFPSLFNNISVPAFLACMSAGHLLGTFAILSLGIDKVI
jgi:photosystem I subunit X